MANLKDKRILITGATGFVGANLARYFLKTGADISIFTRETSDKWRIRNILKDISEYSVDLEDSAKLRKIIKKIKPQIIIHTAVYGGYSFQTDTAQVIGANFIGTVNLINALKDTGFELLINTGSSSEYGIKPKPMKETDLLEPVSEYGYSKAAATLYCRMKAKKENLPIVTLRLFSPYGPYEEPSRLVPSVILACLNRKDPKLSSPDSVRDFIFIEDVMDSYIKVAANPDNASGEVFNIGFGRQCTVSKVVDTIIKLTGNKVRPKWGAVNNPRSEPDFWQADISKAQNILGWNPRFDLPQALEKTINWYRKNILLYQKTIL